MEKLWGWFWIRLLASLVAGPPAMILSWLGSSLAISFARGEGTSGVIYSSSGMGELLLVAAIVVAPLWIAMEVLNHRWRRPLPPVLAVVRLMVFGAVFMAIIITWARLAYTNGNEGASLFSQILILVLSYTAAAVLVTVVGLPVIRRWKKKTTLPDELSRVF